MFFFLWEDGVVIILCHQINCFNSTGACYRRKCTKLIANNKNKKKYLVKFHGKKRRFSILIQFSGDDANENFEIVRFVSLMEFYWYLFSVAYNHFLINIILQMLLLLLCSPRKGFFEVFNSNRMFDIRTKSSISTRILLHFLDVDYS